ncbi:HNH endonuclease signature motif containing protein [Arthrobacter sp. OY3WO11]|uniref:HNH endonuclease signature motif containing protein n=1 Tax=Arthrobacter sp. OY3WO11 TaxID=1835723 RepID=UPI0007CF5DB1|nr:HNH endonuclease signature motif containing protein [Arthrobacter sp. OY3WO11]OAE03158.1 endonuclease [Arthrobacter sp. OY3WO11]
MEGNSAVVEAEAAVDASVAAFAAVLAGGGTAGHSGAGPDAGAGGCVVGIGDDPVQRVVDGALDVLAGLARSEAKLAALKAQAVQVFAAATSLLNGPPSSPHEATAQNRSLLAEVGCALVIGDRAAGALLAESHALTTTLPRTLAALESGTISWAHAREMVNQTVGLDRAGAAALEKYFLDPGIPKPAGAATIGEMPAYRFKHKARTWRERHHPESLEKRHAKGMADGRVDYKPDQDGMAWLSAYLPAHQAMAGWNRLNALARAAQGPDEPRTLAQLRADHFAQAILTSGTSRGSGDSSSLRAGNSARNGGANNGDSDRASNCNGGANNGDSDWVGNGDGDGLGTSESAGAGTDLVGPSSIRAQVLVTVPVLALTGLTDEPAMLDGYGPIPPSMARELVANGADSFHRVLVDPRDGAPLEIGRTSYRVTKAMRNWLRLRDGKCPFPGCNNSSLDNEADHLLAWQNGGTSGISNLGQPCPKHHKLRHSSGWTPTQATQNEPPGWISPSGRHFKSEYQDWEPPHLPETVMLALPPRLELEEHHDGQVPGVLPYPPMPAAQACPAGDLLHLEPPPEEPEDDNLIDLDDIPVDDPLWDDFYALPPVLPQYPLNDSDALNDWDPITDRNPALT